MIHIAPCVGLSPALADLFIKNVFRYHGIHAYKGFVSDRDPRLIQISGKNSLIQCKVSCKMSSAFHPKLMDKQRL
jgi:hypothetical protein